MANARPVLLALALAFFGCTGRGSPPDREEPGGIPTPERIVSMTPAITEILFALDLGDRVVGVTDYCDFPPEARGRARIGGYVNPSVEAILALEPDLVLVSPAVGNREAALAVRRAGARVEVIPAETLAETYAAIGDIARLCGVEPRGQDLVGSLRERIESVASRLGGRRRVTTLFCLQVEPLIAAGAGTLPSELLELAGGTNVVEAARYPQVGIETVLAEAPEVILQARMDSADPSAVEQARAFWSRWSSVPAVAQGRVYVIDATTALRPGPRVAQAVESLAALLESAREPGVGVPKAGVRETSP